jgi:hypothetical protein
MNANRPDDATNRIRLDKSPSPTTQSHDSAGHSMRGMTWMMLLCVAGVIASAAGWGLRGAGGLFCGVMMIAMMWMMIGPVVRRPRHSDREVSAQGHRRP